MLGPWPLMTRNVMEWNEGDVVKIIQERKEKLRMCLLCNQDHSNNFYSSLFYSLFFVVVVPIPSLAIDLYTGLLKRTARRWRSCLLRMGPWSTHRIELVERYSENIVLCMLRWSSLLIFFPVLLSIVPLPLRWALHPCIYAHAGIRGILARGLS